MNMMVSYLLRTRKKTAVRPISGSYDRKGPKITKTLKKCYATNIVKPVRPCRYVVWLDACDGAVGCVVEIRHQFGVTSHDSYLNISPVSLRFLLFCLTFRCAILYVQNGAYRKALTDFESILSDLLGRYGERHERVGSALHNVAIANLRAGSLDDAMDAIEEAIKIRSRSLGRQHPRVADSLVELGIILLSMDEHDDALKVFERALKLRREEKEDVFAEEDIDECKLKIAKVLNNIGCVNFEKGDLKAAEFAFDEAISLQRSVFKNWFTIVCGVDANSPGILTMASTMCNKAYVAIERDHFLPAIDLFLESLKIQRSVLGDDNKLVQSSLDNLGYAYTMLGKYEKALVVFTEVWNATKDSNDFPDEKAASVRKVIICHARLEQWNKVFPLLELLEDLQHEINAAHQDLQITRKLLGEVNYQLLKLPSLSDATNRALGCAVCMGDPEEAVNLDAWIIDKPENTSKMSGHRVTHA
jgi:tetratricopeptide (TPR) repeat protein